MCVLLTSKDLSDHCRHFIYDTFEILKNWIEILYPLIYLSNKYMPGNKQM